jgi:hypothetical protein
MQQLRRNDLSSRTVAERGKGRLERPAILFQGRVRPALTPVLVQELVGDLTEAIAARCAGHLLQPALKAWILATREPDFS